MRERLLDPFEQALTLTDQAFGLVVVSAIQLRPGPQPDVLRQALDRVQHHHPLLRMAIASPRSTPSFVPMTPVSPIPLHIQARQGDDHWQTVAQHVLNQRFDAAQGPLMRCTYLVSQAPGAAADLICAFHHAVMDGSSCMRLYHELLAVCAALQGDEKPDEQPPEPLALQPPTEALLPPSYKGLRLARRLIPFILRQGREEWRYRRATKDRRQPPLHPQSACHLHTLALSREATQTLIKKARQERLTLNSMLSAAMLLAVYRRLYQMKPRLVRAIVFSNLRPYLQPPPPPDYLGCYISMQRVSVPIEPEDTVWSLAPRLNDSIYAANKRGEKYLAAVMSKQVMRRTLRKQNERMATTALSYLGPLKLSPAYGAFTVTEAHGFITTNHLSPEYSAFGHLFLGRLRLDLMYMTADMDTRLAHTLAEDIKQILHV